MAGPIHPFANIIGRCCTYGALKYEIVHAYLKGQHVRVIIKEEYTNQQQDVAFVDVKLLDSNGLPKKRKDKINNLKEQKKQAETAAEQIALIVKEKDSEIERLYIEIRDLKSVIEQKDSRIKESDDEAALCNEELEKAEKTIYDVKKENASLSKENNELKKKIIELEKEINRISGVDNPNPTGKYTLLEVD